MKHTLTIGAALLVLGASLPAKQAARAPRKGIRPRVRRACRTPPTTPRRIS